MRRKAKKFNIFKTLSVILILSIISFFPFVIHKLIKIKKIECISQFGQCPDQLVYSMSYIVNRDYKTAKKQIKQILDQDIQINSYLIQYKIPDTLKIDLILKKPKYAIFNGQKYFLVDKNGLILSESEKTNSPFLVVSNFQNKVGDNISNTEFFCLKIIEKIAWLYSVNSGLLEKTEFKMTLKEGILVHFPLEGDIDILVGSLKLVFSRLNDGSQGIKMSDIREIDLRFKEVVLR